MRPLTALLQCGQEPSGRRDGRFSATLRAEGGTHRPYAECIGHLEATQGEGYTLKQKGNSANFAFTEFSEVELLISRFLRTSRSGVLRSTRPEIATWHTKIRHLGDAPHPARLVAYLCDVTRGQGPKTLRAPPPLSKGERARDRSRGTLERVEGPR